MKTNPSFPRARLLPIATAMFAISGSAVAQKRNPYHTNKEIAEEAYPKERPYSPWVDQNFPQRPFFGDTHLHRKQSFDAVSFGTALGPEEAYRFARGEEITSSTEERRSSAARSTSWWSPTMRRTWGRWGAGQGWSPRGHD